MNGDDDNMMIIVVVMMIWRSGGWWCQLGCMVSYGMWCERVRHQQRGADFKNDIFHSTMRRVYQDEWGALRIAYYMKRREDNEQGMKKVCKVNNFVEIQRASS